MGKQAEAVSKFLAELSLHFGKRFDTEEAEDQWLASMERNLRGYSAAILDKACQRIIDTRKDRYFPLPSECRAACEEAAKFERLSAPQMPLDHPSERPGSHYALADDLIHSDLGRQAAEQGWVGALHAFICKEGRLPKDYEIRKCVGWAKEFDEAYEQVLRGDGGACGQALERLGAAMLARREKFRDRVLNTP